jgi:hypothetical protein
MMAVNHHDFHKRCLEDKQKVHGGVQKPFATGLS